MSAADASGADLRRAVIVVAAGSGTRLGLDRPKALVDVAGRTILEHALGTVFGMAEPAQVIVVVPRAELDTARELCRAAAGAASHRLSVVAGGSTRQASVAEGLGVVAGTVETVLVHDAARSFTPAAQFEAVAAAVERSGAGVIPALPVTDTVKEQDAAGAVVRTLDRSSLVAVQTPQGFPRAALVDAYTLADTEYTDDAALFAAAGGAVGVVPGDVLAFKITTPEDLRRAEGIAAVKARPGDEPRAAGSTAAAGTRLDARSDAEASPVLDIRTGIGIDVHAFDATQPLWLGGLLWPGEPGLAGHSDGDALSHAICDALLSAAGLGDVGARFGTADARYAGARGDVFLRATVALVADAGFRVVNVAVQLVAKRPRLSSRRAELEEHLGGLVGAPVSVAGTTSDGLGFTGTGEGVAALATALLQRTR